MELLEQERAMLVLKHLAFLQQPLTEHCPFFPDCMDLLLPQTLTALAR